MGRFLWNNVICRFAFSTTMAVTGPGKRFAADTLMGASMSIARASRSDRMWYPWHLGSAQGTAEKWQVSGVPGGRCHDFALSDHLRFRFDVN